MSTVSLTVSLYISHCSAMLSMQQGLATQQSIDCTVLSGGVLAEAPWKATWTGRTGHLARTEVKSRASSRACAWVKRDGPGWASSVSYSNYRGHFLSAMDFGRWFPLGLSVI